MTLSLTASLLKVLWPHLSSTSPLCSSWRASAMTEWRIWWPMDSSFWKRWETGTGWRLSPAFWPKLIGWLRCVVVALPCACTAAAWGRCRSRPRPPSGCPPSSAGRTSSSGTSARSSAASAAPSAPRCPPEERRWEIHSTASLFTPSVFYRFSDRSDALLRLRSHTSIKKQPNQRQFEPVPAELICVQKRQEPQCRLSCGNSCS